MAKEIAFPMLCDEHLLAAAEHNSQGKIARSEIECRDFFKVKFESR